MRKPRVKPWEADQTASALKGRDHIRGRFARSELATIDATPMAVALSFLILLPWSSRLWKLLLAIVTDFPPTFAGNLLRNDRLAFE